MPKGYNRDGSPKARPSNSGRKPLQPGQKKKTFTLRLSPDVVEILVGQPNKTAFIEKAIRATRQPPR